MRISYWSSDVCSSDLITPRRRGLDLADHAFGDDRLDQFGVRETGDHGRTREQFFGPQVAIEIDLEQPHVPGRVFDAEFAPAIIEPPEDRATPRPIVGNPVGHDPTVEPLENSETNTAERP